MTIATINEVLFSGTEPGDFTSAPGTGSADAGTFRPGTVSGSMHGPLLITLPRKVVAPEVLAISFSLTFPADIATTGWQGEKVLSLLEDGVEKYAVIMWDGSLAATPSSTTGGRMDDVIVSGGVFKNRFGAAYDYLGIPSYKYNFGNSPDYRFHPGIQTRRIYQVRWDMASSSNFSAGLYKAGWWSGGGGVSSGGLAAIGASSGINGIRLGQCKTALWAEIVVTAETQLHEVFSGSLGGHTLWTIPDTRPDLVSPYGIVTQGGHPGEPLVGYPGVVDGYTWDWELQAEADPYVLVYPVEVEVGEPDPVVGEAAASLADLSSSAAGAAAAPAAVNTFRQRIGLFGTRRRQLVLNATWVPK